MMSGLPVSLNSQCNLKHTEGACLNIIQQMGYIEPILLEAN